MNKVIVLAAALVLCAGLASAQQSKEAVDSYVLSGADVDAPEGTPDWFLNVDLTGIESWDAQGLPANEILYRMVGAGAVVTGAGADINLSTFGGSWLSEAIYSFANEGDPWVTGLRTCLDNTPGTAVDCSTGGILDFDDIGADNVPIPSGVLELEFWESYDDEEGAIDAIYNSGLLTVAIMGGVPVPTIPPIGMLALALALIGLGSLLLRKRFARSS